MTLLSIIIQGLALLLQVVSVMIHCGLVALISGKLASKMLIPGMINVNIIVLSSVYVSDKPAHVLFISIQQFFIV